jgi:hypothetical protein
MPEGRAALYSRNTGAGWKVSAYDAGTVTPKDIYTDPFMSAPVDQPFYADPNGYIDFYGNGDYRLVFEDADGVIIKTLDWVRIVNPAPTVFHNGTVLPGAEPRDAWSLFVRHDGAGQFGGLAVSNGRQYQELTSTLTGHLFNVKNFGATGNGVTADGDAFVAASVAAVAAGGTLYIPAGTYYIGADTLAGVNRFEDYVINDGETISILGDGFDKSILLGDRADPVITQNLFDCRGNCQASGIGLRDTGLLFLMSNTTGDLDMIDIRHCRFENTAGSVYWNNPDINSSVRRVTIVENEVNGAHRGIFIGAWAITSSDISHNVVRNVSDQGIKVGFDDGDAQILQGRHRIIGNLVDGVEDETTSDSNGIWVAGEDATIIGNVVKNISNSNQNNTEGIYTKCRGAVIVGNSLFDAGHREAAIDVKGDGRDNSAPTKPKGYGVIVANNTIRFTEDRLLTRGINIACDDVLVTGNYIEGCSAHGIYSSIPFATSRTFENWVISNNVIRDTGGQSAITIASTVTGLRIIDNEIVGVTGWQAGSNTVRGIFVWGNDANLTDVTIRGNRITGVTGTDGRSIQISNESGSVFTDVTIDSNYVVCGSRAGITISGDETISGKIHIKNNDIRTGLAADNNLISVLASANYSGRKFKLWGNHGDFVQANRGRATLSPVTTIPDSGVIYGDKHGEVMVMHGLTKIEGMDTTPELQDFTLTSSQSRVHHDTQSVVGAGMSRETEDVLINNSVGEITNESFLIRSPEKNSGIGWRVEKIEYQGEA